MSKTHWTEAEVIEFVDNHERIIQQYPSEIQDELRGARTKWLAGVPRREGEVDRG